jgi:hypothetical protein
MGVDYKQAMRNGQNKRMRGRNRKSQNPLTRVYESNGPDVKIRGTASHVAEKYLQLARDSMASGDPVGAENYHQHAEHYFRLIAAAQEQFRQQNPYYRPEQETREDAYDDGDEDSEAAAAGDQPFGTREPQPYLPREGQPSPREQQPQFGRDQQTPGRDQQAQGQHPRNQGNQGDGDRLPAFITGQQHGGQQSGHPNYNPNGYDNQGDRFPLHRRRRRHRGQRPDQSGSQHGMSGDAPNEGNPGRYRPPGE